mgnify:CR=1 FL=1
MLDLDALQQTIKSFTDRTVAGFKSRIAIVSGSGQGFISQKMKLIQSIPFEQIPGFIDTGVAGHDGEVQLLELDGHSVVFFKGRFHWYAGAKATQFHAMIQFAMQLGCDHILLTNAAGSLNPDMLPGELVMVTDHINFQTNPLMDVRFKEHSMFVDMGQPYSESMCRFMSQSAKDLHIKLHQGTYMGVHGPNFETRAEVKCFARLGADVVGMSTLPEVLVSRYYGLQVACISAVVNLGAGMTSESLSHDLTLERAQVSANSLEKLILNFIPMYHQAHVHVD